MPAFDTVKITSDAFKNIHNRNPYRQMQQKRHKLKMTYTYTHTIYAEQSYDNGPLILTQCDTTFLR